MHRYWRCCNRRFGRSILVIFTLFVLSNFLVSMKTTNTVKTLEMLNFHGVFESVSPTSSVTDILNRKSDDPMLVNYVRLHFIEDSLHGPYNFIHYQQENQSPMQCSRIDNYLQKKEHGSFLDIGAKDGEQNSVSLFFERWRNWTGLLVEEDPVNYKKMRSKRRKALTINVCVKANVNHTETFVQKHGIQIPCLWMETILKSHNKSIVDLLIININDQSADILKSIPFKKFNIRVITVSFPTYHFPTIDKINQYMIGKNYIALHQYINGSNDKRRTDIIFVNSKNNLRITMN